MFKALADPTRRRLLDDLNANDGLSVGELCTGLDMARQSVSKHLAVLEDAALITAVWHGRHKLHYLNVAPIQQISDRWIRRFDRGRVAALATLRQGLESPDMSKPEFVYTTYIRTTGEQLWEALTAPDFTTRYWALRSNLTGRRGRVSPGRGRCACRPS